MSRRRTSYDVELPFAGPAPSSAPARRGVADAATSVPAARRYGARELATALGRRPPTDEQAAVIEHLGADGRPQPFLVVAGAGSGKTETMAARVVWLVANGIVRPERVLGLTFTRKAAGELGERLRSRLAQLRAAGLVAPAEAGGEAAVGEPVVSTYHSYAGSLFAEHALRLGREPSVRLLGEAQAWQLTSRVVDAWAGDLSAVRWGPPYLVGAVQALSGQLAEHLVEPEDLRRWCEQLAEALEGLPRGAKKGGGERYAVTEEVLRALRVRAQLVPLVQRLQERKRQLDAVDFGDQVALAATVAREQPAVGALERERYDVVLLDEYQDTGTAQREMLTALFGEGHPVTAVGDPCQSIYGWRGASAGNLRRFPADFRRRDGGPSSVLQLTTSFRNGGTVLAVANRLSEPLRRSGVPVADLHPRPGAERAGRVVHALHEDAVSEATWVAAQVASLVRDEGRSPGEVAVLARTRSQFPRLERALRDAGLPVEVSGIGGLLSTPEVADVVATLAVLVDLTAGGPLVRLLTGPRWRIGPRDLVALSRRAGELTSPSPGAGAGAGAGARGAGAGRAPGDPDGLDERSLVEALDDLGPPSRYSPEGARRLAALAEELRSLRRRTDQALPDLVADVVRTARLDVEVLARGGRQHLDRLLDVAADFAAGEEDVTVPAFLAYLEAAAEHERGLDTGRVGAAGDAVQLLTIHAAKGLEWPVVVVPGMVKGVFPSTGQGGSFWGRDARALPFALRGDRDDLPPLEVERCADQVDVRAVLDGCEQACKERDLLEERRLAYVAVTRAQDVLLCSGYRWDHTASPRTPSPFLEEVREVGVELLARGGDAAHAVTDAGWACEPPPDATNPAAGGPREQVWPADPLPPEARSRMAEAAERVRAALAGRAPGGPVVPSPASAAPPALVPPEDRTSLLPDDEARARRWQRDVERLLGERARDRFPAPVELVLPPVLSVSALAALRRDPAGSARWMRRPVPLPPSPHARRGTAFHAWLEGHFGLTRLVDVDELPGAADEEAAAAEALQELKDTFLRSRWADRRPVEVELPFETPVHGLLLRGRIDAVFREPDGSWDVIDWKTGQPPTSSDGSPAGRQAAAAVQLAAYRLAWHRLSGCPLDRVRAGLHYVPSGETVRPVDNLDEEQLLAVLRAALPGSAGSSAAR